MQFVPNLLGLDQACCLYGLRVTLGNLLLLRISFVDCVIDHSLCLTFIISYIITVAATTIIDNVIANQLND